MKRMCGLWQVKKGMLQQYLEAHEPVSAEMLKAMHDCGIRNYSMFFREDGLLVGYFEADDPAEALRKCAATDASKRWAKFMEPYFEAGHSPLFLKEYFYMK